MSKLSKKIMENIYFELAYFFKLDELRIMKPMIENYLDSMEFVDPEDIEFFLDQLIPTVLTSFLVINKER